MDAFFKVVHLVRKWKIALIAKAIPLLLVWLWDLLFSDAAIHFLVKFNFYFAYIRGLPSALYFFRAFRSFQISTRAYSTTSSKFSGSEFSPMVT